MYVHKEAIVIAVLNGRWDLVMETILKTKASSILQFIHGLRGELHLTWEEGTWAAAHAGLRNLAQPGLAAKPATRVFGREPENIKPRNCCARFPASARFELPA
jgi:hypothetical protein